MGTEATSRLSILQGYLDLDPENLVLLNDALRCALVAGLNGRAEELAKSILNLAPDQEAARCALVLLAAKGKRSFASTAHDEQLPPCLEVPSDPASTYSLATDLAAASRWADAARFLEPLLEDWCMPLAEHPASLWLRAMLRMGRSLDAWDWFLAHRVRFGTAGDVARAAALVALECGMYDDAMALSGGVLEVNALDSEAAFTLASTALIRGDTNGCCRALSPGLEVWRDFRVWLLFALAQLLDLRFDVARDALSRCLGLERAPAALQLLGCLQLMSGNFVSARSLLQEAAEKDPDCAGTLNMLSRGVAGKEQELSPVFAAVLMQIVRAAIASQTGQITRRDARAGRSA